MAPLGPSRAAARRLAPAIAAGLLCGACGAGASARITQSQGVEIPANAATQSRSSNGMTVTLSATPARTAAARAVFFRLELSARSAAGALVYRVSFGDGSTRRNVVPEFCRAAPGGPEHGSWLLSHRYARAGTYRVTLQGSVNCQRSASAVVAVDVVIT